MDVEAKPGSKRNIGEADFFLPLMQDGRGLLFGNARLRIADHDNREGNLGVGYRRMQEGGWNFGGYGYYDRRRSTTGNYFNQMTFGAEALGRDWDFRGNVYLPQGDKVRDLGTTTMGGGTPTAAIVGTTVQVTTPGSTTFTSQERALKGYDLEAGWRAPVWAAEADKQLRLYAGGYHFSDGGVRVSGPRVRAELTMAELPALWKGAQLILGAEYQDDNARGGQGFVSARLRIPLGSEKSAGYKMNWQERRMAAPVVRDVDVVTQARTAVTSTPATVETATATVGGQTLTVLDSGTTTGAALAGAVAAAGANSVVVLTGTFATPTGSFVVQNGQTLMGTGTLNVSTPSGRTAALSAPGATVNFGNGSTLRLNQGSTLTGLTAEFTNGGIDTFGNNISVIGNTLTRINSAAGTIAAIGISGASNAIVVGNTIAVSAPGGISFGIAAGGASGATVANNSFSLSNPAATAAIAVNGTSFASGSTGNTMILGASCENFGGVNTGSVTFTNAPSCP